MKKIIFTILLISLDSFAAFPKIQATGVNGDYVNGEGLAYAEHVEYELPEVKLIHKNIDVNFNKPEKFLVISDKNSSVSIKFDFSFMNVFNTFNFKNVELLSDDDFFKLTLDQIYIMLNPSDFTLHKVELAANIEELKEKEEISFLEGFIYKGKAKVEGFYLGNYSFESLLEEIAQENFLKSIPLAKGMKGLPLTGRHISFETAQGKFYGQLLLDSWLNFWLRFNGDIYLTENKKELVVDLQSARLGYFSIRTTVLKRLMRIENDKIKIEGSKIRISLESSSKQ